MIPFAWKVAAGAAALVGVGILAWRVDSWRERSELLDEVQLEYADYRAGVERDKTTRQQEERIDREISKGYLAAMAEQDAQLAAARVELRAVRLRVGACPDLPPTRAAEPAASGAVAAGSDGPSAVVARSGEEIDAEAIAERFSACDAAGARLNALIDRVEQQASLGR